MVPAFVYVIMSDGVKRATRLSGLPAADYFRDELCIISKEVSIKKRIQNKDNNRRMTSDRKNLHVLRPNPKFLFKRSNEFAEAALAHYNRRKKIKLELIDVKPYTSVPEPHCCYTHINFTARSIKEGSKEQLFFAELLYRGISQDKTSKKGSQLSSSGRSQCSRGLSVTCCEPLGPDAIAGQKFLKRDVASGLRKHAGFTYCLACSERMLHPEGEKFIAGHCNVPRVYDCVRYR